jgi:CMP-N-acetylneuraminic acid synthetase
MIAHTFTAARNAEHLDRCILSTDSTEMAELAAEYRTECPFLRPSALAQDDSTSMDVCMHVLTELATAENYYPDYVMLLQPTSPFRTAADIDGAITAAKTTGAPAVISVTATPMHPWLMKTVDAQGILHTFVPDVPSNLRRQALPDVFALNGAIYLVSRTALLTHKSWCPPGTRAWIMPEERSLDIDTPWDLHLARLLAENPFAPPENAS